LGKKKGKPRSGRSLGDHVWGAWKERLGLPGSRERVGKKEKNEVIPGVKKREPCKKEEGGSYSGESGQKRDLDG